MVILLLVVLGMNFWFDFYSQGAIVIDAIAVIAFSLWYRRSRPA
jgi:hypothetical protein